MEAFVGGVVNRRWLAVLAGMARQRAIAKSERNSGFLAGNQSGNGFKN